MFVVTLSKASVKKLGVGAMCCALVVFSAMLGRYISTRSVAVAAASNKIESAQDIQTWFTGYGLDVDGASITADKVKIPRKWDDSFSAFNGVVQQSGMDPVSYTHLFWRSALLLLSFYPIPSPRQQLRAPCATVYAEGAHCGPQRVRRHCMAHARP